MSSERIVVWIPTGDHGWDLEPARPYEPRWLGGGLRTLHELAVAIACTGRRVEMRGVVHPPALDELCDAAGARPELPDRSRPLTPADTVIVPEGIDEPLIHARLSLSPARVIVMVLGPPGLIGWSFTPGWSRPDPLTVEIDAVARPEHFRGAAALGLELWTHSPGIEAAATTAGVGCRFIGHGQPGEFPDPLPERDIDVVTVRDNRWASLAEPVTHRLTELGIDCVPLPPASHDRVLEAFGRARIFLHPARVEGHSRIGCEARAMGAVPVVLDTNPYAVGLDESGGAVAVGAPAEMADAVASLLHDRGRLERLSGVAMTTARRQVEWEPYLGRVEAALDRRAEDPGRGARAAIGAALRERDAVAARQRERRDQELRRRPERLGEDRTQLERSLAILNEALVDGREELTRHKVWLESVNASMSWRLTAPLRSAGGGSFVAAGLSAASRALDRRRASAPAPASGWPPPRFFDVARGRVDTPAEGDVVPREPVRMLGWCLFPASAVARVDVVVDSGPATQARLGMERPDVAELTAHPGAPVCGFELIVDLSHVPPENEAVTFETVAHAMDGSRLRLDAVTLTLDPASAANGDRDGRGAWLRARSSDRAAPSDPRAAGPLRVLAFSHQLSRGGASLYLCELLSRLAAGDEFEFGVVSLEDGPLRDELEAAGIPVHVTNGSPLTSIDRYEGNQAELRAWAAPQQFDVALINTLASFAGADLAARLGIPAVWSIHESLDLPHFWAAAYPPGTPHPYVCTRAEEALERAAAVVFPAQATQRLFAPYAAAERLITLPYGIELPEIDAARRLNGRRDTRRRLGLAEHATVILCLGAIEPRKSQAMLAQAFAEVADRHPSALLLLVGKTDPGWCAPYVAGLEEYLARSHISSRVRVEPTSDDPYMFHSVADLLVCASDVESLPRSIVEALAFETPVLSTEVFGVTELIEDGRTGFLCPPRDAAALARALDRVLGAHPEQLRSVALAGAQLVRERHDPVRHAAQIADLLRGVTADLAAFPGELLSRPRDAQEPSFTRAPG